MNKTKIAIVIIVILAGAGIYWFLSRPTLTQAPTGNISEFKQPSPTTAESSPASKAPSAPAPATVTYTDQGFSPSIMTIKVGGTVAWVNNSSGKMWVASGIHPTHALYSGTTMAQHCPDAANSAFDACTGVPSGQSWTFIFNKTGAWKYHNHLDPGETGTIIVQ